MKQAIGMASPLRIEYPAAWYRIMNRGQCRRNIFPENKGRQSFLDLLADITRPRDLCLLLDG